MYYINLKEIFFLYMKCHVGIDPAVIISYRKTKKFSLGSTTWDFFVCAFGTLIINLHSLF